MFGKEFKCDKCSATYHAGATAIYETKILPKTWFKFMGDARGAWVITKETTYCGTCSEIEFPQILDRDVKFRHIGGICY